MYKTLILTTALLCSIASSAFATPEYRGFQIAGSISDEELAQLKNQYNANIVRIQIGDDALMDEVTGQAYIDMMEDAFDRLDVLLPKLAALDIKVVFALYSPPGGFETRVAPSHYRMFSDAALQPEYIDMWLKIINRYKNNSTIYAFDLLNEPALKKSSLGSGARDWNGLLLDTIAAIRAISPDSLLMVKSLYGDPSKLSSLPAINDSKIIYSYHPYLFLAYQHSGIDKFPTTIAAPNATRISAKLEAFLGKFYLKHYSNFRKGKVPTELPTLNTGEIAVSGAAKDAGTFLDNLLSEIETDGSITQQRNALKKVKKKFKQKKKLLGSDFRNLIQHQSWTIHAFDEAPIWDPRYQCESYEDCTFVGDSDRNQVINEFMSRN